MSTREPDTFWPDPTTTNHADRVGRLAGWASIAMFLVWIGFTGLAFAWNLEQRSLIHRLQNDPFSVDLGEVRDMHSRIDFLNHALPVLFAITAVVFITWLYLEYRRLERSHALRFRPGWAIGAWFVPFLNLFRPFQIVEDVWKSTAGRHSGSRTLVACWWGSYLLSGFIALRAGNADEQAKTLDDALNVNALFLVRAGSLLVAALLALIVVRGVLRNPVGEQMNRAQSES